MIKSLDDALGHLKWMRNRLYFRSGVYNDIAKIIERGQLELGSNFLYVYKKLLNLYVRNYSSLHSFEPKALKEIIDYFEPIYLGYMFEGSDIVNEINELYKEYEKKAHPWKFGYSVYDAASKKSWEVVYDEEKVREMRSMTEDEYMGRVK